MYKPLLACLCVMVLVSCKKDAELVEENNNGPTVSSPYGMLHYDAANFDAPLLGAGTYESAARFTANQISAFVAGELLTVWFYLKSLPSSCEVRIYQANAGNSSPDSLLYSANLSGSMEAGRWNKHDLSSPIEIPNKDLWVSIRYTHSSDTRSLGCDPGPATDNGDQLWTSTGGQWITLRQFDGTNINWNIRTVVLP